MLLISGLWSLAAAKAALSTIFQCGETCFWRYDALAQQPGALRRESLREAKLYRRFVYLRVYSDDAEHLLRKLIRHKPTTTSVLRPVQVMALSGSACSINTRTTQFGGLCAHGQAKRVINGTPLSSHKTSFGNLTRCAQVAASSGESPGSHEPNLHTL